MTGVCGDSVHALRAVEADERGGGREGVGVPLPPAGGSSEPVVGRPADAVVIMVGLAVCFSCVCTSPSSLTS